MLVLDANVFLAAAALGGGFELFGREQLVAPPILWPEVRSSLHTAVLRELISREVAERSLELLDAGILRERRHRRLGPEVWRIADELLWQKTYDAEYLALAYLLDSPLVTLDRRILRAAERLGIGARALTP
ncbi:MAG: type II toxin-antitoxin system VapC family toxin [Actinomycetota bacterium]